MLTGSKPAVSVVIPCYNGSHFLSATLQSVRAQSYQPSDVIVVDDGSTDDSAAIAESFGPPVRVIRQENQGESVARNCGIASTSGDYLLFLDADDLLHPEAVERLVEAAEQVGGGVANMGCAWFRDDPQIPFAVREPTACGFFPEIIDGNLGPPHTWLVPRECALKAGGFRTDLQMYEDWEFWCRVGLTGAVLAPVRFVGAYYRRHDGSQLARANQARVARGQVCVMETLCTGILANPQLLMAHGPALFWSIWRSLHQARQYAIPWAELAPLVRALEFTARHGPPTIRQTKFARLIRLIGARWSETLRSALVSGPVQSTASSPG